MADAADTSDVISDAASPETPGEDFIRAFTQSQRRLFLYILPLVGNAADADEVLQETNLVIWRKWRQFEPGSNFLAWGRTIARLEFFRFRRTKGSKLSFVPENILELVSHQSETISDEAELRQQALAQCLEQLRPKDRDLIQMRYAADNNGDQVARKLGRPANSVYQSLGRIRRTLMECIQHRLAQERLMEDGSAS